VAPEAEEAPISVEQGLARELGLALGDAVDFDVQGTPVKARVASLREVEWRRLEPNFFIVFPAGVLEAAPRFHVAAVKAATPADSARIQRAVVEQCPNVSAIDLSLVMQTVDGILGKVEAVVRLLALVTGGTGLLVLAGAMLAGRHQRQREGALLRTLGGTRWQLSVAQGTEHAVVGVLAALLGCALAAAANAVLANRVFRLSPAWPWETMVGAVFVAGALTLLVGWLANRGASKQTPLEVLRGE
jgi:putative ABC transport system permease protein